MKNRSTSYSTDPATRQCGRSIASGERPHSPQRRYFHRGCGRDERNLVSIEAEGHCVRFAHLGLRVPCSWFDIWKSPIGCDTCQTAIRLY